MALKDLWEHQKEGVKRALELGSHGFFMEMGTGKTRTTVEVLRKLYSQKGTVMSTLILCPPVVVENWRQEILKFSKIPNERICKLVGSGKQRVEKMIEARAKGPCIFITNYESLSMKPLFDELLAHPPEILVCDESQRIKNPEAKRTKQTIVLSDLAKHKFILSGTPVLRNLMDVWSQFRVLDGGKAFGTNFFVFRNQYFYNRNAGNNFANFPDWRIRPNSECLISSCMQRMSMSVKKEECLDLPDLVREKRFVSLGKDQARAYEEMKKHFITIVMDKAVSADLALTKGLRLQQIVSGFANPEDGDTVRFEENERLEVLYELLEELTPDHKVIVWACFKENYQMIREVCEKLKIKYVELHGEIPQKRRDEYVYEFENNPEVRVVIGNQGAAGLGINLVAASYAIYFSRNFSLEHDLQSEARNHRSGSERHEKITRIDLVAEKTIDEEVLEALANKQAIGETLLREIARRL